MNQSEDLPTENIGSEVINHRKELLDVLNSLATNQEIQATLGISAGHEKDNPEFWRIQRLTMIDRFRIMLLCQLKLDVMTQVDDMTPGVQHQLAVLGKTQIDDGLKYSEVRRWWNLSGRFVTLQAKCLREERVLLETLFFIDVGNMPPQRVKAYLESIKNEMKQKRIPNESGGTEAAKLTKIKITTPHKMLRKHCMGVMKQGGTSEYVFWDGEACPRGEQGWYSTPHEGIDYPLVEGIFVESVDCPYFVLVE